MQWFVLIVIFSHFLAEWCQQFKLLQAGWFRIKFEQNSQAEHENINTSKTPTNHLHRSMRDSSPADTEEENKMSEGETEKNVSLNVKTPMSTQVLI